MSSDETDDEPFGNKSTLALYILVPLLIIDWIGFFLMFHYLFAFTTKKPPSKSKNIRSNKENLVDV